MQLKNEFEPIRDWAKERGIFEKGNIDTQFEKLLEEVNELKDGIENKNDEEIIDAIGDCVVVLTNLANFIDVDIEYCINIAYKVIKNRKGVMKNGHFIRDKTFEKDAK